MKAETALAKSRNDYVRYSKLREIEAIAVEKFEEVEAAYREAQVNLESVKLQKEQLIAQKDYQTSQKDQLLIENSYSEVTAPIDGEILILYRPQGSYVTAGTPMALVGDFSLLNFSTAIEDESARRFSIGEEAILFFNRLDFSKIYDTEYKVGNAGKSQQFIARIVEITPALSEPATIRKILWEIDNTAGLLEPQTYNNVDVQAFNPYSCLTVPLTAMSNPARDTVFVVTEDGKLARRSIVTGADDGEFVEILDGLNVGDVVVTSGTDRLENGMKATITLEDGDNHG